MFSTGKNTTTIGAVEKKKKRENSKFTMSVPANLTQKNVVVIYRSENEGIIPSLCGHLDA